MLKILPTHIANLIAAGEVVNRPASAVKELVENSIDAGARNISVIISGAGKTLIKIVDDGCGMSAEDAVLAFEKHATSKISTEEDLNRIMTMGFRGEALPSIAAVADVTLRTRTADSETGTEVRISGSVVESVSETACPAGTSIEVRDLFYNVPARRKFLKSDNSEFNQICSAFIQTAMSNTGIGFTLTHHNRTVFDIPAGYGFRQRIQALTKKNIIKEIVEIRNESSIMKISGYIGKPDTAKKELRNASQFFFVNRRFFRSPALAAAVAKGYGRLLPDGYKPDFFIEIELDPSKTDVNIHPSKTTVNFEDENMVCEFLRTAVSESLALNSLTPSIDFSDTAEIELGNMFSKDTSAPQENGNPGVQDSGFVFAENTDSPESAIDPGYNPFEDEFSNLDADFLLRNPEKHSETDPMDMDMFSMTQPYDSIRTAEDTAAKGRQTHAGNAETAHAIRRNADIHSFSGNKHHEYRTLPETNAYAFANGTVQDYSRTDGRDTGQDNLFRADTHMGEWTGIIVKNRFIVTAVGSGILVVNIQKALERILYDKYSSGRNGNLEIQTVRPLVPIRIDLMVVQYNVLADNLDVFAMNGFEIETENSNPGSTTIIVHGVPEESLLHDTNALAECIATMTDNISENNGTAHGEELARNIRERNLIAMAKAGAKYRTQMTAVQAKDLIDRLFICTNPEYTPTGERTVKIIDADRLEKLIVE